MNNETKLAIEWFKNNDVSAHEDDGSICISVNKDTDVQISSAEVAYRANLQASKTKTYICHAKIAITVEAQDEFEAEQLAGMEMDIGDIDWDVERGQSIIDSTHSLINITEIK